MSKKIRVGLIGASPDRSWAVNAHIPALKALADDFEITAISTTRRETAERSQKTFGVPLAFDNHHDLVTHPDVDVVVVTVKVPYHFELASAALNAGKAVYCEWPLGNGLQEAEQLAALAKQKGVLAVAGMQARFAPAVAYVRDLIKQGHIGEVLSTSLVGSGSSWGPAMSQANAYTADINNGATMLTIPVGHTMDALCSCLGEVREVTATMTIRRKTFTLIETNETKPVTSHDQVSFSGLLDGGIALSLHYRGGSSRGTNLLWEINGSEGDLQMTADSGHAQIYPLTLLGGRGDDKALQVMPIPEQYRWAPAALTGGPAYNVAQAYVRFAEDYREGTHHCPTFDDAVKRHRMLRAIEVAAATGQRQTL